MPHPRGIMSPDKLVQAKPSLGKYNLDIRGTRRHGPSAPWARDKLKPKAGIVAWPDKGVAPQGLPKVVVRQNCPRCLTSETGVASDDLP